MFEGPFSHSILKNAQSKNALEIRFINLREYGIGAHKMVDDTPFGGGIGMVMRVDVLHKAIQAARDTSIESTKEKVILLTADGIPYTQRKAESFAALDHVILLCGHYEGVDERIRDFIDEEITVGDVVLTGGEIPAMLIADSVTRLLPGVLKEGVTSNESFSLEDDKGNKLLEYPMYTKPREYEGKEVPEILLTGHHERIEEWRKKSSYTRTVKRRPDLLSKH